jgi:hypothetical protein
MDIAAWHDRKMAQWDRVRETCPGLQLSRTGRDKGTYIIRCSVEGFEDAIVFGRMLPASAAVDMTNDALNAVIQLWRTRRTAVDVKYMPAKYDPNVVGQNYAELEPVRRAARQAMQAARKRASGGS